MPLPASDLFRFLASNPKFAVDRHEVSSAAFDSLRYGLRMIFLKLREGGDPEASEFADRVRNVLSECLTVPVPLDGKLILVLEGLGTPNQIERRWGRDIRVHFHEALSGAHGLLGVESPVRSTLRMLIIQQREYRNDFRIYSHKSSRPHFDSLIADSSLNPILASSYLHSSRDYRETGLFDSLIKVGPLRSWGWGAAPDALLTAPRFRTLSQIVWAGSIDELGFGYDPIAPTLSTNGALEPSQDDSLVSRVSWTAGVTRTGDGGIPRTNTVFAEDDFQIFGRSNHNQKRRAILVQIDTMHGMLCPVHSTLLSFDPSSNAAPKIGKRLPGDSLQPGMFVIRSMIGEVDVGGTHVAHDHFSKIWKARLIEKRNDDLDGLTRRLFNSGVHLTNLPSAIRHWCIAPTTVIHSPQKQKHFELLISALDLPQSVIGEFGRHGLTWWQNAWQEIRSSRGEAIQAGMHSQELIDEELTTVLSSILPAITERACGEGFTFTLPPGTFVQGVMLFDKVLLVEEGFLAPESELKVIREMNTLEQWRA